VTGNMATPARSPSYAVPLDKAWPRDRIAVLATVAVVAAIGWLYLLLEGGRMSMRPGLMDMSAMPASTSGHVVSVMLMWGAMTLAMMLPSAAPAIVRPIAAPQRAGSVRAAACFALGYLASWTIFGLAAALLQLGLEQRNLLTGTMAIRDANAAALLLVAAGVFQLGGLKRTCLRRCHASAALSRDGGSVLVARAGMRYGISCLGCCALPMGLMFVGGVMNVLWMALLSLLVFAEKNISWGSRLSRFTGVAMASWGAASLMLSGGF
jgi:predicted metal-binding membrane protein